MDIERFWALIDASRGEAGGDPERQLNSLRDRLRDLTPGELVSFQGHLDELFNRAYRWDLGAAADLVSDFGCSDDGFEDFRGWLVGRGRVVFEGALDDPDSLAGVIEDHDGDCQFEDYYYLAGSVWAEKTNRDPLEFPKPGLRGYPEVPDGVEITDLLELQRRFPRLWRRFGGPGPSSGNPTGDGG